MADYISDDDEFEKFKQWWKESGQQLLLIALIAVAGFFGWQYWQEHRNDSAEAGFIAYQKLQEVAQLTPGEQYTKEQKAEIVHLAVSLKDEYGNSQYAYYAGLMLAKLAYLDGDAELAMKELNQVMDEADIGLSMIARLRLARIEAESNSPDAGLNRLAGMDEPGFNALLEEARGDFYQLKGDNEAAEMHYKAALEQLGPQEQGARSTLLDKLARVTGGQDSPSES